MAPRFELFRFRYRDPVTGKWIRARYVATRDEIAGRHQEWEILGAPEVRDVDSYARYFTPHRSAIGNLGPILEPVGRGPSRRVTVAGVAT